MATATAPGKVILFGEHAVVYGQPAIAAPVTQVRATATVEDGDEGVHILAPDLGRDYRLGEADDLDALAACVHLMQQTIGLERLPPLRITVQSTIPIASGLGSGAATAAALLRALARYFSRPGLATNERIATLTYEIEKIHHGTPSGIDNTVVAYEQPVYFVRGEPQNRIETFRVARPVRLLVADSGVRSSTKWVVGDVRRQWQAQPAQFEEIFAACGRIARTARQAIEAGDLARLGRLMDENQSWLETMTVSSPELEKLVAAARAAGALGAKLSGAGRGGNVIALVTEGTEDAVREALFPAGARAVLRSVVA